MKNINVKEYIDTYNDFAIAGDSIFKIAAEAIDNNEIILFDMSGQDSVSTVFLNTSFGQLIDKYGIERVKQSFKFTNILRSQIERIRKYFNDYSEIA